MKTKTFPIDEYYEICYNLERFHEVFSTLWKLTKPSFTEKIDTAAVLFDPGGGCINFLINEKYWRSLDEYSQEFVICHEMLHVILTHGIRTIPYRDKYQHATLNAALDLAVNHLLTTSFGFCRFYIKGWDKLCWADTIFKEIDFEPNKSFEYYINKIEENLQIHRIKVNVPDHSYLSSFDKDAINTILDSINEIDGKLDEKQRKDQKVFIDGGHYAGKDDGSIFNNFVGTKLKKLRIIKKWESVLTKYMVKSEKDREMNQWIRVNKRISCISSNIFLPSDSEVTDIDFYKYNIWLFLDYSGSCGHLRNHFFDASKTFDPQKFIIRKFAHTTEVDEFQGDETRFRGGGTSFSCIENFIQKELQEKKIKKYPDAIFHFTDGCGDYLTSQKPENWYVFLTDRGWRNCYPEKTNFFALKDFIK